MASKSKATQNFVPVREVRDGIVILKDGSLRAVLMISSLNFALKSTDEQTSILYQFQNFLNSLDFSVQIFIQSRDLDIRPYIAVLEERLGAQNNDLMRIQVREYIDFVRNFTENANIMTKNFFVVVPYTPSVLSKKNGVFEKFIPSKKESGEKTESFEEYRAQLEQRTQVVEQGLSRTGVRMVQLGTEEVIELLYKIFNPGELQKPASITQQS